MALMNLNRHKTDSKGLLNLIIIKTNKPTKSLKQGKLQHYRQIHVYPN